MDLRGCGVGCSFTWASSAMVEREKARGRKDELIEDETKGLRVDFRPEVGEGERGIDLGDVLKRGRSDGSKEVMVWAGSDR